MIKPADFYEKLNNIGIEFFAGVPDSLLKDFCAYVTDNTSNEKNIIAANEGNAIALAAGYNLSTDRVGLVYMQNSGLGNSINPLLSLVEENVYDIPMLLIIGWRGEPNKNDACQHLKQGEVTKKLLDTIDIKYNILPENTEEANILLGNIEDYFKKENKPYALIVRRGTFEKYELNGKYKNNFEMSREEAIEILVNNIEDGVFFSTTGKASRELYEIRERNNQSHDNDFLMVGSMGHISQIALSVAVDRKNENIYCLDGDGSMIMHLGGLSLVGSLGSKNFKHVILNNGAHDSVGGQPTVGFNIDINKTVKGLGYETVFQVETKKELEEKLEDFIICKGPALMEIKIHKGARDDLGRPDISSHKRKELFMDYLQRDRN